MNISKKHKFIIWATAGCGSRSCMSALANAGVDDLLNITEDFTFGYTGPFTHQQGIPDGYEHFPVICLTRNPYSRIVSAFLDEKNQFESYNPESEIDYSFDYWLENIYFTESRYPTSYPDFFVEEWEIIGKTPDFFVRMENMEIDLKNIPVLGNIVFTEENMNSQVRFNNFMNENPLDEYVGNYQKYQKYYNEKNARFVYSKLKNYFDIFGYDKDSWK